MLFFKSAFGCLKLSLSIYLVFGLILRLMWPFLLMATCYPGHKVNKQARPSLASNNNSLSSASLLFSENSIVKQSLLFSENSIVKQPFWVKLLGTMVCNLE